MGWVVFLDYFQKLNSIKNYAPGGLSPHPSGSNTCVITTEPLDLNVNASYLGRARSARPSLFWGFAMCLRECESSEPSFEI